MRRRVAAGQTPKSKKGIGAQIKANNAKLAASPLGQLADTVLGFAFPAMKAGKAAAALKGSLGAIPATKRAATMAKIAYNDGRVLSRIAGRETSSSGGSLINDVAMKNMARQGLRDFENIARPITERLPYALKTANRAGTTVRRGRGTVNQKGLEEMIAGGREPSREMLRIPQILKGTNEAYESIAQKAIKAAGLRKTPKKRGGR
jgi:hypothetical protein